jgi:hypothetical protein
VCVCVCVYVWLCNWLAVMGVWICCPANLPVAHIHTLMHTDIHTHKTQKYNKNTHSYIKHTHTYTHIPTHIHKSTHKHTNVYINTRTHAHTPPLPPHTHTNTHTNTHTHTHTHTRTHTHACAPHLQFDGADTADSIRQAAWAHLKLSDTRYMPLEPMRLNQFLYKWGGFPHLQVCNPVISREGSRCLGWPEPFTYTVCRQHM